MVTPFTYSCHHYTAVGEPTNVTVTPGENSISLEWSPPSEGSPLSYTVTWTGSGVTSSHVLPPTARNYTIRGLDSNTAYSGTVEVYSLANNATVFWGAHTLPQGEQVCPVFRSSQWVYMICFCSNTACIKTCIIAYISTVFVLYTYVFGDISCLPDCMH